MGNLFDNPEDGFLDESDYPPSKDGEIDRYIGKRQAAYREQFPDEYGKLWWWQRTALRSQFEEDYHKHIPVDKFTRRVPNSKLRF